MLIDHHHYNFTKFWIFYLGGHEHLSGDAFLFTNTEKCKAISISLQNGEIHLVTSNSNVPISEHITLRGVYYMPSFTINLLSISKLFMHDNLMWPFLNIDIHFWWVIADDSWPSQIAQMTLPFAQCIKETIRHFVGVISTSTWHQKLGHTSSSRLNTILK